MPGRRVSQQHSGQWIAEKSTANQKRIVTAGSLSPLLFFLLAQFDSVVIRPKRTANSIVNSLARLLHAQAEHVHVRPQVLSTVEEDKRKLKVALEVQGLGLGEQTLCLERRQEQRISRRTA